MKWMNSTLHILLLLGTTESFACLCDRPSLEKEVYNAKVIVVARINKVIIRKGNMGGARPRTTAIDFGSQTYQAIVKEALKGNPSPSYTWEQDNGDTCRGPNFHLNEERIFFGGTKTLFVNGCSSKLSATQENITKIKNLMKK